MTSEGVAEVREGRLLNRTTSLCRVCKNAVPASILVTDIGEVWMLKTCDTHGEQRVRLSTNAAWYERTRATPQAATAPSTALKPVELGCPFDCGPCASHTQKIRLPVVTITSACNLDCPICYVHNKNDGAFHMSRQAFESVLERLEAEHGRELDIVNLTGGEPTLHPEFLDFIEMARHSGAHRVTACTNGIRLAKDESLVRRLAELGGRVALSFDTFEAVADEALQGARLLDLKLACLDLLERYDVATTLIPVMTKGVNDHEIGAILDMAFRRRNVRHVEVHTMTFTGPSGINFPRSARISMIEVLEAIEAQTGGLLRVDDFVSSPCAHPLCYQIAYLLMDPDGGPPIPFTRFIRPDELRTALSGRLYLEPSFEFEGVLRGAIDRLWVEEQEGAERTLRLLKRLLASMFPADRVVTREEGLRAAEHAIKAVYVHSHMDEETFDTERAMDCCDSNCYADGTSIPVCNYNVLYRDKEAHFNLEPRPWQARTGGQKSRSLPLFKARA